MVTTEAAQPRVTFYAPHPFHDLTYVNDEWTCPITGFVVQKNIAKNLQQREDLHKACSASPAARLSFMAACQRSFLLWLNMTGWSYRQHEVMPDGTKRPIACAEMPFITWPVQDHAAAELIQCINTGQDVLIDKSREMGATVLCVAVNAWMARFTRDFTCKVLSKKEEEVDEGGLQLGIKGNSDTLMWRFRYLLDRQPEWMRLSRDDGFKRLGLPKTGAMIRGESTNKHAARGTRPKVGFFDECSVYEDLEAIERSSHSACGVRIWNATPVGPGAFANMRFSGKLKIITMGWWDHPEKGAMGRYPTMDAGVVVWHGPFRQHALDTTSRKTVAQNLDIDYERSGNTFFDLQVIERHKQTSAKVPPVTQGVIETSLQSDDLDEEIRRCGVDNAYDVLDYAGDPVGRGPRWRFRPVPHGALRVWCPMVRDQYGQLRPRIRGSVAMGIDISQGTGATPSVISGFGKETGEQWFEWCSSLTEPTSLARIACQLGYMFRGTKRCALLAFENNGPGAQFACALRRLDYHWLFKHIKHEKESSTKTETLGWTNNRESNSYVCGALRDALEHDAIIVRSPEALAEAELYCYNDVGVIESASRTLADRAMRECHGDRWRSILVAWEALQTVPREPISRSPVVARTVGEQLRRAEDAKEAAESDYSY